MTDTPTKRIVGSFFVLLLDILIIGFCWPLTALSPVVYWLLVLTLVLSDFFVSIWVLGLLPDSGWTREVEVYGWWTVLQVMVFVVVVAGALVHSGLVGLIVLVGLLTVYSWRAATINKVMDIRVW